MVPFQTELTGKTSVATERARRAGLRDPDGRAFSDSGAAARSSGAEPTGSAACADVKVGWLCSIVDESSVVSRASSGEFASATAGALFLRPRASTIFNRIA